MLQTIVYFLVGKLRPIARIGVSFPLLLDGTLHHSLLNPLQTFNSRIFVKGVSKTLINVAFIGNDETITYQKEVTQLPHTARHGEQLP